MLNTSLSANANGMPVTMVDVSAGDRKRRKTDVPGLPKLRQLIEAHRVAYLDFDKSIDAKNEKEHAYMEAHPKKEIIIINLLGGGVSMSAGREACISGISDMYIRRIEQIRFLEKLDSKLFDKAVRALGKMQARNMISIEEQFAEVGWQEEAFGLGQVNRQYDKACDRERDTLAAVCSYRCQTMEEVNVKAAYLAIDSVSSGCDPDMLELLVKSMTPA